MLGRIFDSLLVIGATLLFFAGLAWVGLFSSSIWSLIVAVLGCYSCYFYGRYGRLFFLSATGRARTESERR